MEDGIFGKTFFGEEKVKVYTDITGFEEIEMMTSSGTMLINPNVYFMYNIGTANNTIIHKCVHWDRHRRPFELQRLLERDCSHISCEIAEKYEGILEDASAFKWMEWKANQLAPRILMPAKMTKRNQFCHDIYQNSRCEILAGARLLFICIFLQASEAVLHKIFLILFPLSFLVHPNDNPPECFFPLPFLSPFQKQNIGQFRYILVICDSIITKNVTKIPELRYNFCVCYNHPRFLRRIHMVIDFINNTI